MLANDLILGDRVIFVAVAEAREEFAHVVPVLESAALDRCFGGGGDGELELLSGLLQFAAADDLDAGKRVLGRGGMGEARPINDADASEGQAQGAGGAGVDDVFHGIRSWEAPRLV